MPCYTTVRTQIHDVGCSTEDIARPIEDTVPLSVTMREKVTAIREWGRTRARPAAEMERKRKAGRRVRVG